MEGGGWSRFAKPAVTCQYGWWPWRARVEDGHEDKQDDRLPGSSVGWCDDAWFIQRYKLAWFHFAETPWQSRYPPVVPKYSPPEQLSAVPALCHCASAASPRRPS